MHMLTHKVVWKVKQQTFRKYLRQWTHNHSPNFITITRTSSQLYPILGASTGPTVLYLCFMRMVNVTENCKYIYSLFDIIEMVCGIGQFSRGWAKWPKVGKKGYNKYRISTIGQASQCYTSYFCIRGVTLIVLSYLTTVWKFLAI